MRLRSLAIFILAPVIALAQQQENIYFSVPEILHTAGVKWVTDIYKDHRGLMWFATNNGLFRFDGANLLYARNKIDDPLTLPSNDVTNIAEDKEGNMWIGTAKGGAVMDANTLTCTRLKDNNGYSPGYKFKFFVDGQDNIWAETDAGLYKYNKQKKYLQIVWSAVLNGYPLSGTIISVASYNNDELVLGTVSDIVFINKNNLSYHRMFLSSSNPYIDIAGVYVDDDRELWVYTWNNGLFHFNKASKIFNPLPWQKNVLPATQPVVKSLIKVHINGSYFLYAGLAPGLAKIQLMKDGITPAENGQSYYHYQPGNEGGIPMGNAAALYADENNNLWIGFDGDAGIAKITLSQSLITTLPVTHEGNVQNIDKLSSGNKSYYAVCSWHGSTGLLLLDGNLKKVKAFDRIPENADHDGVNVSSTAIDNAGRLWISSWKGVTVMDKNLQVIKILDHNTKGPDTLYKEKNNFLLVSNDTVWIASYKRGIDLFTTGFKKLKHYSGDDHGLRENLIWKFFRARNGRIWLLGNAFLYSYNPAADEFIPYYFSNDKAAYSPADIAEKKDGSLLIATASGLIQFNPSNGRYNYIRSPLLEKEDNTNSVCVDDNDDTWYLTDQHLVHYNFGTNIFTLYGKQDGLDVANGLFMLRYAGDNRLLIGQLNKIIVFTPPPTARQNNTPGLLVTGVYVNDSLIYSSLPAKGLTLNHSQNKITMAFACVNYDRAEQNIYAYRLKNTDSAWTYTRQGLVTYANLAPGNYMFEVKAANYAGIWSAASAFGVHISPPFWQSWWFRLLAVAAAASATYSVFRWRVNNIRKEEKIKTDLNRKMAQLEMKALRAQMNPHFVFNSLSSIQESIVTGKTGAASKYLSKFSKLIRLILENSGKQFIPLKTEIASLNLYLELESFRFENFTYTFSIDPAVDTDFTTIPTMVIQPFVENALKHGLSKKKDDKQLKIDIRRENDQLVAIVEDNGVGRAAAAAMKSAEKTDHHSMGIKITEERLRLLGFNNDGPTAEITDLFDKNGRACGTLVKIILPAET